MNFEACQELFVSLTLRSTALVAVIWLGFYLSRNRSAPFRCALLTTGMVGLALLPLTWCLPRVEVPFLPVLGAKVAEAPGIDAVDAQTGSSNLLIVLWFLGIGILALCQSVGLWQLQRWRDRSQRLDSGYWHGLVHEVSEALGYRGKVSLYRCPGIHSPAAAGLFQPCVFMPEDVMEWDAERLRVVLLHEIGHVKRRDLWTQWLSQTVCALYWFHPLVWMLNRALHQTREFACDHTVLSSGTEPSHYARHLLALAKNLSQRPSTPRLAMANGLFLAMASPNAHQCTLEQRVRAILSFRSSSHLSLMLGSLVFVAGLSAAWATATFTPMREEPVVWTGQSGLGANEPAYSPVEMHLRLNANPFPGER
ncbi:MAG: beta-lactamase regulating signal transducer with metallopeptidase domain [Verrucomicrobiales bacterium]|jgi:beta-lactamase regulating signal transducer with metallopeptidase domain